MPLLEEHRSSIILRKRIRFTIDVPTSIFFEFFTNYEEYPFSWPSEFHSHIRFSTLFLFSFFFFSFFFSSSPSSFFSLDVRVDLLVVRETPVVVPKKAEKKPPSSRDREKPSLQTPDWQPTPPPEEIFFPNWRLSPSELKHAVLECVFNLSPRF